MEGNLQSMVIASASTWEAVAIVTGLVPTISAGLKALPIAARAVVVVGIAAWLAVHVQVVQYRRRPTVVVV